MTKPKRRGLLQQQDNEGGIILSTVVKGATAIAGVTVIFVLMPNKDTEDEDDTTNPKAGVVTMPNPSNITPTSATLNSVMHLVYHPIVIRRERHLIVSYKVPNEWKR